MITLFDTILMTLKVNVILRAVINYDFGRVLLRTIILLKLVRRITMPCNLKGLWYQTEPSSKTAIYDRAQYKRCLSCCISIAWFLFNGPCFAGNDQSTKTLMQEKTVLTQAWQLSENYAQGLTVAADPFKALAWQYVYVMLLPHAYPGSYSLLLPYKAKVAKERHDEAFEYSKWLMRNYQLPKRMDENQLIRVFEANNKDLDYVQTDQKAYPTFERFLKSVAKHDESLVLRYKNQWQTLNEEVKSAPLVYGQLIINGAALEQSVARNQPLIIDAYGFFIGKLIKPLMLNAKGYQSYQSPLLDASAKGALSLGRIALMPLPSRSLGSLVGSVSPLSLINQTGLALIVKDQFINKEEPWFSPSIAITKLDNGQFYVKGLSAGTYELIASYQGNQQRFTVSIGSAQVKTIKPIRFN